MSAGRFPAGSGRAGFSPVRVAHASAVWLPRALKYDPATQRFVLTDAAGKQIDVHPYDQMVATRIAFRKGSSQSAQTLGTRIQKRCERATPERVHAIVLDEVRQVLADLIANKDILLVSVDVDTSVRGRILYAVTYVNLRDPKTNPRVPLQNAVRVTA